MLRVLDTPGSPLEASVRTPMEGRGTQLRREVLLDWMRPPCIDVRSVAFAVLFDPPIGVQLPDAHIVNEFFLDYLGQLLSEDASMHRTPSRYLAGQLIRAWFQRLWRTDPRPESHLAQIRDLLGRLLLSRDERVYDAVLLGALEHLFVEPSIVEFFRGWRQDSAFRAVFLEVLELAAVEQPDKPVDNAP